jgi:peptidoglycan-N-acetylglucosamine deacetylase
MRGANPRSAHTAILAAVILGGSQSLAAQTAVAPVSVALTFDDLPAHIPLLAGQTRLSVANAILTALRRRRVPEAFGFVTGSFGGTDPDAQRVLLAWRRAGHPLANHSWSHFNLDTVDTAIFTEDITRNESIIQPLMGGQDWRWFRYPYLTEGSDSDKRVRVQSFLAERRYRIERVTLNFDDWAYNEAFVRCTAKRDRKAVAQLEGRWLESASEALSRARSADPPTPLVALLHISTFTARMLPRLLSRWEHQGVRYITLSKAKLSGDQGIGITTDETAQDARAKGPDLMAELAQICF